MKFHTRHNYSNNLASSDGNSNKSKNCAPIQWKKKIWQGLHYRFVNQQVRRTSISWRDKCKKLTRFTNNEMKWSDFCNYEGYKAVRLFMICFPSKNKWLIFYWFRLDPNQAIVLKISAPIKSFWAKSNNLNFDHLLSASSYKEQHRRAMIDWSEEERCKDPGIFCRQAVEMYEGNWAQPLFKKWQLFSQSTKFLLTPS